MKLYQAFSYVGSFLVTGYRRLLNPARSGAGKDAMKMVRRTHLYAGLFLAPWVAMYGFSGFIFNHHSWFADPASKPIEWTVDLTALPAWPEPEALARKVVTALNAAGTNEAGTAEYRLAGAPKLEGGLSLQGQDEGGGSVSLFFDREQGRGSTSYSPPEPPREQVKLATNDAPLLNATKAALLAAAGKAEPKFAVAKWSCEGDYPRLTFPVERGQERRVARYDLRSGEVTFRPAPEPHSLRTPDFLTSLHMSRGYPAAKKSETMRMVHAVFVDAMAVLMCFWAVSGIAMWLQMKQLRRPGLMVVIASVLSTGIIWKAMHRFFTGS